MATLPAGTVTYLMTDIVGSARLWEADAEGMAVALRTHDRLADAAAHSCNGHLVKSRGEGDSLFMVFTDPAEAVSAAVAFCSSLAQESWPEGMELRVRAAIHTGTSEIRDEDYYGPAVNRCARLRGIANSGQILVSRAAQQLISAPPAGVEFRDLGMHRLKDLLRPEAVAEVLHPSLPHTIGTLGSLNCIQHNLPVQLTSFVGRFDEVLRVRSMLQAARLVTLTGSGGCGKTRLALQIGAESGDHFKDGVWFVDLTRLAAKEDCASIVAKTLHLGERPGIRSEDLLTDAFADKRALLILDNCEHVIDNVANLVVELLPACPELVILATSREALRLPGEVRTRVPSLSLPPKGADLRQIATADAVKLFCDRAKGRTPDFQLSPKNGPYVAELCHLLDGMPLAIEQAASHAGLLTPHQMVVRFKDHLRDLGSDDRGIVPRHKTIRATIEWSFNMLSDDERLLLQRCSVFVASWSLEAAEFSGIRGGLSSSGVSANLQALLDKSLVFEAEGQSEDREFRMLATVREFALEKLGDQRGSALEAHADYFGGVVQSLSEPQLSAFCHANHENILIAVDWYLAQRPSEAPPFVLKLRSHLLRGGYFTKGRALFEASIIAGQVDSASRAYGLNALGAFCWRLCDYEAAEWAFKESVGLWSQLGNEFERAAVSQNLGLLAAVTATPTWPRSSS